MAEEVAAGADDAASTGTRSLQSVDRAFILLEALAAAGGSLSLSELTAESGLPPATIHRVLKSLSRNGYVRRDDKAYTLGPNLIFIGRIASTMLGDWARPTLTRLAEELGETANLAALDADDVVYLAQLPSNRYSLRMLTEVGKRLPTHATAAGKVLLANLPPQKVEQIIRYRGLPQITERTITSERAMIRQVEMARLQGFAVDDGEHELGVRCVAVPVPDSPRNLAVSISGPDVRMSLTRALEIVPTLQLAAKELSTLLK
jgi:IclR family acetate operon transcriptional repressor